MEVSTGTRSIPWGAGAQHHAPHVPSVETNLGVRWPMWRLWRMARHHRWAAHRLGPSHEPVHRRPAAISPLPEHVPRGAPARRSSAHPHGIDIALGTWRAAAGPAGMQAPGRHLPRGSSTPCPDAPPEYYIDRGWWRETAQMLLGSPRLPRVQVDSHHAFGLSSARYLSLGRVRSATWPMYALARESFGDIDIIVHCHDESDCRAPCVARAVVSINPLYYEDPLDIPYRTTAGAAPRRTPGHHDRREPLRSGR